MAYNRNQKHRSRNNRGFEGGKKRTFKKKHHGRHDFVIEGNPDGVKVPDTNSYTLERALRYLKRQLKDSEKIIKYRSKKEYIKPSLKRRREKEEAIRYQQYKVKNEKRDMKGHIWTAIIKGKAQ